MAEGSSCIPNLYCTISLDLTNVGTFAFITVAPNWVPAEAPDKALINLLPGRFTKPSVMSGTPLTRLSPALVVPAHQVVVRYLQ